MDVGTPEGHCVDSPTCTRCVKYSIGHQIQDGQGPYRLEIEPRDLQPDQPNLWATRSGLVRIQTDSLIAPLLQLETRPASRSNGCFSAGLETQDWVCQPTLVPYEESSESSDGTGSPNHPSGSSVEGLTLVPSPSESIVGVPLTDPLTSRPDSEPLRTGVARTDAPASRVAYLREKFNDSSLSEEASSLLLASWRSKLSQSYDSHFRKWISWCAQRGSNPVSGPVAEVTKFLAYLFQQGYQSRSLNAYRSAISSVHDRVDDVEVGKYPMVTRLLKGAFHGRPPLPHYTSTWDVRTVLDYIEGLGSNSSFSLKQLSYKLCMLLSLTRPSRSADLASLQVDRCRFSLEGVTFLPAALAKQSRQGRVLKEYFFPSFPHNRELCPVDALRHYIDSTSSLHPEGSVSLFVALVKPHNLVSSSTIAHWLKGMLQQAGIDVSIFGAHLV